MSQHEEQHSNPLGLPAPKTAYTSAFVPSIPSGDSSGGITLAIGGPGIELDLLGPVVLNEDGTLSRIANWHQMTESEQRATQRVISQRNDQRRRALESQGIVIKEFENRKAPDSALEKIAQELD